MYHDEGSDVPICPWCDHEQKNVNAVSNGEGFILKCEKCYQEFFVEVHTKNIFYSSHIIDELQVEEKDEG